MSMIPVIPRTTAAARKMVNLSFSMILEAIAAMVTKDIRKSAAMSPSGRKLTAVKNITWKSKVKILYLSEISTKRFSITSLF